MQIFEPLVLGEGILTWPPGEREINRFGTVCLCLPGQHDLVSFDRQLSGAIARLAVTVTEVRAPALPPDRYRRLAPSIPRCGEQIDLGVGALFILDRPRLGPTAIGVLPTEQRLRPEEWMDPVALYRAQNHEVRLTAYPFNGRRSDQTPVAAA
ncbi:hypothetical protein GCM10029992_36540 [Glycomyces albus]